VTSATGLSAEEVQRRQNESGPNRVTARRGIPAWLKFLRQFNQPLVYILLVAVGVTAFLGEWVDSSVILGVSSIFRCPPTCRFSLFPNHPAAEP
jgi:cation-transporting ATPase F